ncbi:protein LAZ1 [Tanacetum coccineum]
MEVVAGNRHLEKELGFIGAEDSTSEAVVGESSGGNEGYDIFGNPNQSVVLNKVDLDSEVEETLIVEGPAGSKTKGASTPSEDTDQAMHVKVIHKVSTKIMFCSFIYAGNLVSERRLLWAELGLHKLMVRGYPWTLLGDFNVALNFKDTFSGSSFLSSDMIEFKDCVADIELTSKLKALKKPLRKLVYDHGNKLRHELDEAQKALDLCPTDQTLRDEKAIYVQAFNDAKLDEEHFLKQKAKIDCVPEAFVNHYKMFLGTDMTCDELNCDGLFNCLVSDQSRDNMVRNVTDVEIKAAMFSIRDDRAPGPDGYTSAFFKKGWDVVGQDVYKAVRDFFTNGQILKEINHTFIALIPKVSTPLRINDYRPISCCNVIYKCISKILTNRIIKGTKEVVSDNQSAFVLGGRIFDNILITQELMYRYHRNRGPPRCAFKNDTQNAYDTVDWRFLGEILIRFGFYPLMTKWIMACVTSTSFSIGVNGDVHGLFKDDLFIFARGDVEYISSLPKSTAFFCNVDCKFLVEKAKNRIGDWKNKSLSFAGRLQLCRSVISSMHVYWASVLMIPIGILLDIEQLIRGFLWCNGELKRGKAKIGNGKDISVWFDVWCDLCPLIRYLTPRDIAREGFTLQSNVSDLMSNVGWRWPQSWLLKAPSLGLLLMPILDDSKTDVHVWRNSNGVMSKFLVKAAWEAFRPRGNKVSCVMCYRIAMELIGNFRMFGAVGKLSKSDIDIH